MEVKKLRHYREVQSEKDKKTEQFIRDIRNATNYSSCTNAVCVIRHKTGEVSAITTSGDPVEVMGLIEVGKNMVYEQRWSTND